MNTLIKQFYLRITFSIFTFSLTITLEAQEISPYLIGNNAWYDGANLTGLWDDMALAKFQTIRIGGNATEGYGTNWSKYINLIDGIRLANAEPIVQVPHTFSAQQAIDMITYINITSGKKIKLWHISNEPDLPSNNFGNAAAVSTYIKRISSALKSVDSTIIVMGPETSWYQNSAYMTPLIGGSEDITGKDPAGHFYIDVVTFHKYMFSEISGLESDVNNLLAKFNIVNANRPEGKKLSWGLTEFNSSYDNGINTSPDMDVWSFHAGQMFAEVYGLGMRKSAFSINAWSMLEGQTERAGTDLSLFDKDFNGRSNYYHCLMLGQNLKKYYRSTTDNKSSVVIIPMSDTTGIAVMVLNKDHTNPYQYTLRLDNNAIIQANALQINVNAGINVEVTGSISKESTQMLVFDTSGVLYKRYTYTSFDADGRGEPLIEYFSNDPIPVVSLTKPVNDTILLLKSPITLNSEASDNGTINKVEFTSNGALIGTSRTPPYSYIWTPAMAGTYIIAARAYDESGGVGFSSGLTVIVEKDYNYIPVPGTIEAEAYDEMSGIQLETTTDVGGGKNVGYCEVGDWLDYTINVPNDGKYLVEARLASTATTGAFSLKEGTNVLTSFALTEATGGWQTWTTLSKTVNLKAGNQTIRLLITGKSININWIKFSEIGTSVNSHLTGKIQVYPNPSYNEKFTIYLTGFLINDPVMIDIFNLSGQNVYSQKITVNKSGSADVFVNENNTLKTGLYIISAHANSGTNREKLFVSK